MPSSTKKQAHYMSALAHGWSPAGKHPSQAVAEEFHEADKREGKWEHAAKGGAFAHLPAHNMPKLVVMHSSPLAQIAGEHFGQISHPSGMIGAHARMPRVPIQDTMRNIDSVPKFDDGGEVVRGSSSPGTPGFSGAIGDALAALKSYLMTRTSRNISDTRRRYEDSIVDDTNTAARPPAPQERSDYAMGGAATMHPAAIRALHQAMQHLQNMDAGSAASTLRASPAAMAHPDIRAAEAALRTHQGLAPAQKTLRDLQNTNQAAKVPASFSQGGRFRRNSTSR